jgi:hypothetical protein
VESSNPETVIVRYLCRQPVDVQFLRA